MNKLPLEKKVKIVQMLTEGASMRSTSRIVGVSINTVTRLLEDLGHACLKFHSETAIQIRCKRVECDEQWSFIHTKDKRLKEKQFGKGSVWTWLAIDPDSKFAISWFAGERNIQSAKLFMNDLWCRLRTRVQLSTDGLSAYKEAVDDTFGQRVDFAQLVKNYDPRERYTGATKTPICGNPDRQHISTSIIERFNLTTRMTNRRFTRATNAHSKKYENHCYSLAITFVHYNFVRYHSTLRVTPAMRIGLTKRFMKIEDLINLIELYPRKIDVKK